MSKNKAYQSRLPVIDILRGIVLLVMALDHTRDFWCTAPFKPTDLAHTYPLLFFTRWITHFCAPVFVFLAGVSAYLYQQKNNGRALSAFLIKRGLFLMALDIIVISICWEFNYHNVIFLGVIWVIGCSMLILALLHWLPRYLLLTLSIIVIAGHNFLDGYLSLDNPSLNMIWHFLHVHGNYDFPYITFYIHYLIIPWFAVMSFGYCLGPWFQLSSSERSKRLFSLGLVCLSLFICLRTFNLYGDPVIWETQTRGLVYTMLAFLNVSKYPPSLLYLTLTLGLVFLLWPLFEKISGKLAALFLTYGKVSMFFYIIHLPIIHGAAVMYAYFLMPNHQWPVNDSFSLLRVYVAWAIIIICLYPVCKAYKKYKSTHNYAWLHYI